VTRIKEGMKDEVMEERKIEAGSKTLEDQRVKRCHGEMARRIKALVVAGGTEREMTLGTNQLEWTAATVVVERLP